MSRPKTFDPAKCHNCQKIKLPRKLLALCPRCFLFVDTRLQATIAELYDSQWEATNSPSEDFKKAIETAVAQAAMGTLKAKPVEISFRDCLGSKIERGNTVRLPYQNRSFIGKVTHLNSNTGLISVRLIADPPDIIDDINPKTCEVIHERQSDEHPDA